MAGGFHITPALSDTLTILGAAGIVIPTFARFKINPVIGFILVGIIAGPFGLGALVDRYPAQAAGGGASRGPDQEQHGDQREVFEQ